MGFTVNGQRVDPGQQGLLTYLREGLGLTSVKNGCSEGACGTCMVLVDGAPAKACLLRTEQMAGKAVVTVEGIGTGEKAVYARAFGEAGAVQCGFCLPGMVISAKGLLDRVPDPTRAQVKAATRGNLCRCTGYKRIVDGILLAGRYRREGLLDSNTPSGDKQGARSGANGKTAEAPDAAMAHTARDIAFTSGAPAAVAGCAERYGVGCLRIFCYRIDVYDGIVVHTASPQRSHRVEVQSPGLRVKA